MPCRRDHDPLVLEERNEFETETGGQRGSCAECDVVGAFAQHGRDVIGVFDDDIHCVRGDPLPEQIEQPASGVLGERPGGEYPQLPLRRGGVRNITTGVLGQADDLFGVRSEGPPSRGECDTGRSACEERVSELDPQRRDRR